MAKNIGIIGAGAWGTALSLRIAANGHHVKLWSRNREAAHLINQTRENKTYLPGAKIPEKVLAVSDFAPIVDSEAVFLAMPSQNLREICKKFSTIPTTPLVICSKGIEEKTLALMSEIVAEIFPKNPLAILSGPNFASEIAAGLPAAATLACRDKKTGELLAKIISSNIFRIYNSDDVVGAEVGGAVKNVIAIACGIAIGKGYGENARAALITRGLFEITKLALKLGGKPETLSGLSGLGDLVLTCSSQKSRNMSLGYELGKGRNLKEILAERGHKVTEGVVSAHSVVKLAEKFSIEMPIASAVYGILYKDTEIEKAIESLLERKPKEEF